MGHAARARLPGSVPALCSASVAFVTAIVYVLLIASEGSADVPATILVTGWIIGLGVCALVGGLRASSDRVIALGAATGGLFGAAVLSLLSIGVLFLIAAILALLAWIRAGAEASRSQQLLGAFAGLGAALGFLAVVVVI